MALRIAALFLALGAVALFWAWRPPFEKVELEVRFPDASLAPGLEVTWLAEGGRMGRAMEVSPGIYVVHARTRALEVLGESVADTLASFKAVPATFEVSPPTTYEVVARDSDARPVHGLPLLLLPESARADYLVRDSNLELMAERWAEFEVRHAMNRPLRVALQTWHAESGDRQPGETGWAQYPDGDRVWELDEDVAMSPTQRWCPADSERTYARTDRDGLARWEELPLGWEGFLVTSSAQSPEVLYREGVHFGSVARGLPPELADWMAEDAGPGEGMLRDVSLDSVGKRDELRLVPTATIRGEFTWTAGAGGAHVDLGRKSRSPGTLAPRLQLRGERRVGSGPFGGLEPTFEFASLKPGDYLLIADSGGATWYAADLSVEPGEDLDLGLLSVPENGGIEIDVEWETSTGETPRRVDIKEDLWLELTVEPDDGSAAFSHRIQLKIQWPAPTSTPADPPRARTRLIGLPSGRLRVKPLEPSRGRNDAGRWQLDPAYVGPSGSTDETLRLTLPLVAR